MKQFENGFEYTVENEKASITKYDGSDENLIIPAKLGGYDVTGIGNDVFQYPVVLESIKIPDSIRSIGIGVFSGCVNLTRILISKNHPVYRFNDGTLFIKHKILHTYLCAAKNFYKIPYRVTSIEAHAFSGCTELDTVIIPNSVKHIGDSAFKGCTELITINIPNSVTRIEPFAFEDCCSLIVLEIPNSTITIGKRAFQGCSKLTLRAEKDSNAHKYAIENDINFVLVELENLWDMLLMWD